MTWTRSDLSEMGLGYGLVSHEARICLTRLPTGYVATGRDGRTRSRMSDAEMREWFRERGVAAPSPDELNWLTDAGTCGCGSTTDVTWTTDPYASEIHNVERWQWMCKHCLYQSAMDI